MKYATFTLEKGMLENGYSCVAGMDEAGRGCIAGPVVAAVVIIVDETQYIPGVFDSKVLSPKIREEKYKEIINIVESYGIAEASVNEIDTLGIGHATALAMNRAYSQLDLKPELVLIDGSRIRTPPLRRVQIKEGDRKHYVIAAASVLAKVYRDRLMKRLARVYENYGLERHVGYGTEAHLAALKKHGITKIHRKSYSPVMRLLSKGDGNKES